MISIDFAFVIVAAVVVHDLLFFAPSSSSSSLIGTVTVRTENTARSPPLSTSFPSASHDACVPFCGGGGRDIAQPSAELSDRFEHASASDASTLHLLVELLLALLRLGVTHPSASVVADPSFSPSSSSEARDEKVRPMRE